MNEHEILVRGTFDGQQHDLKVRRWFPNESEKFSDLGQELTILIWSDGHLNDEHDRTTYVIFKHVEHVEKWEPDEQTNQG